MKVTMKLKDKKAVEHAKNYKGWDNHIIASDSFAAGYKAALELKEAGEELVEVEFANGEHQLRPERS